MLPSSSFRICSGNGTSLPFDSSLGNLNNPTSTFCSTCSSCSCEINGSSSSHAIESSMIFVRLPTSPLTIDGLSTSASVVRNEESGELPGDVSFTSDVSSPSVSPTLTHPSKSETGVVDGRTALQVVKQSRAECRRESLLLEYLCAARPKAS